MIRTRRAVALLLCGLLLCELCSCAGGAGFGGNTPKLFDDTDAIKDYAEGFWVNEDTNAEETSHYRMVFLGNGMFYRWDFTLRNGQSLEDVMMAVLQEYEAKQGAPARSLTQLLLSGQSTSGMKSSHDTVLYDAKAGQVLGVSGEPIGVFYKDGTFLCEEVRYHTEETTQTLSEAFAGAMENRFQQSYSNLSTYKDVRYNAVLSLGKPFFLTGTAELDDYYNYEYRNLETVYFCICVTPPGGSYSDQWYICGSRYQHEDLFERLKKGPANVMLVCTGYYMDALKNELADLRDYCWE